MKNPSKSTISKFKNENEELEEHLGTIANSGSFKFKNENELLISEFFYFTVKKGQELNLISNKVIGIDGTFLKANAEINNRASQKEINLLEKTIKKKFTSKRP